MKRWLTIGLSALVLAVVGCTPEIGDPCLSNLECPERATCDTTATGGYCMIFDCTSDSCPDEAVCIAFRTFNACMRHCESDDDCRVQDGQVCRTDLSPAPFCYHTDSAP